ncbi:MAG: cupin domain-containing protein [Thermoproteota archaeon]
MTRWDYRMKKSSIYGLREAGRSNFLDGVFKIGPLFTGGLHFYTPGEISHSEEERHIHEDHDEIFIGLQGKGTLEVEGKSYPINIGDIYLIEPGESHHVMADEMDPILLLWIGARRLDQ